MDMKPLPIRSSLEQYEKQAEEFLDAHRSGDSEAMRCIRRYHPYVPGRADSVARDKLTDSEILSATFDLANARFVVARWYGFESWPKLTDFVAAVTLEGSLASQFESAVEAIITGDVDTLQMLLRNNPDLVRARSMREHGAMLLLYVGANLVEGHRQKSPPNAIEVARVLLEAGAEVDAAALTGGGGTTLGQVATSVHPARVGVQIALMETLLDYGAAIEGSPGGYQPLAAALANGRPEAAEFLAERGAQLDIVGAAGLGRLHLLKDCLNHDGSLKGNQTKEQLEEGFILACLYGQTSVAEFLLEKGVDPAAGANVGQTGLHYAAHAGHLDTVKMLLERKAPLEVLNVYGGTVLGQATWSVMNGDPGVDYVPVIEMLLDAGAKVEAADYPTGNERVDKVLQRHGARS
jgi:ankyrin repeat protein